MKTIAKLLPLFLIVACTAGCAHDYQNKPSPAMASTTHRWVDIADDYSYVRNINQRAVLDDWNRLWYTDNPSRLTPWPVVDQSPR